MSRVKFRITLATLIAAFLLIFGAAVGSVLPAVSASAATYTPGNIFSAGTGGEVASSDATDGFVRLELREDGSVYYRRDLALKWYERKEPASEETPEESAEGLNIPAELHYFSMSFTFGEELLFEKLTLSFESAEENITKEAKSTNALVFTNENGKISVAVKDSAQFRKEKEDEEFEWSPAEGETHALDGLDVALSFNEEGCGFGEFNVLLGDTVIGTFTNVGGNFMEYFSSASSTPRTPITFKMDKRAANAADAGHGQYILMKELNGQSLATESGRVTDNKMPALVINEEIHAFTLGARFNLSYEAIDVCDDSVNVIRRYYMLKRDENGDPVKPNEPKDVDGNYTSEDGDYKSLTTSVYFMPTDDKNDAEEEYVSIRFELDDGSGLKNKMVYLAWYAAENAVATLGEGENAYDYILVNREKSGPEYVGITADAESKTNTVDEAVFGAAVDAYREEIAALEETGISAGEGSYFYLPSLRGLFTSSAADYRNLRFSIFYHKASQAEGASASSQTSLRYNALRFEIDERGQYTFRVLATDASGNAMKLYLDGQLVEVTSSNIWDFDEIPEFSFRAGYDGARIEAPTEASTGWIDSPFTVPSFDVVALEGYETVYELYRLDESKIEGNVDNAETIAENSKEYFEVTYKDALVKIDSYNDKISEDDPEWELSDNKYHWNPDSLSFRPQEVATYFVKLTVIDTEPGNTATAYRVIKVNNPTDEVPRQAYWLQDNLASVVLFAISALLAVIVVVLLIVKPSDKNVEEVDLKKLKGSKK